MRREKIRRPRPAPLKRGPLVLLGDGVLLFLVLAGAVGSFCTAFTLDVSLPLVYAGCALCALIFLAVWSLPRRWWALPLAVCAGLWGAALWRMWDGLALGEVSVRCSVVNTFCLSLGLDGMIQPAAELPADTWTAAATLLVLLVTVPLGALLGLGIVRLRSFWFAFWCSVPLVLAPLCISVTPGWLPLMALVLGWCVLGLTSLVRRQDPHGAALLNLVALPAGALLLSALTLAMPQDSYQRPAWADDALEHITSQVVKYSGIWLDGTGPFGGGGGGRLAASDGSVSLNSGPLRFSGRTVLEVDTELEGRIYLRGFSGALYDGERWLPLSDDIYSSLELDLESAGEDGDASGQVLADKYPNLSHLPYLIKLRGCQPLNFPALAARSSGEAGDYAAVTVHNVGADPGYVYAPYQLLTQPDELSGAEFVYDSHLARAEDIWTHTLYVQPDADPARDLGALTGDAAVAEEGYREFARIYYMMLPNDPELYDVLSANCSAAARPLDEDSLAAYQDALESGTPEPVVYARIVADYLASIAEYDPNTPATPEGEDYVTYFLTESRRGYCMHFASAAVLMLRWMGVPARYVAGYVADVPASGHVRVPDSAAHAWVEVYIEGYGWEPVEVTPAYAGSTPGQSGVTAEPEATPTPTPTPSASQAPEETDTPAPTASQAVEPEGDGGQGFDPSVLWVPLAVLLLVLAFPLRRRLARRGREKRFGDRDTNRAAVAVYRYLRRLEPWGGETPEEITELAKKARFSNHTLTEEERHAAVRAAGDMARRVDAALPRWKRLLFRYVLGLY